MVANTPASTRTHPLPVSVRRDRCFAVTGRPAPVSALGPVTSGTWRGWSVGGACCQAGLPGPAGRGLEATVAGSSPGAAPLPRNFLALPPNTAFPYFCDVPRTEPYFLALSPLPQSGRKWPATHNHDSPVDPLFRADFVPGTVLSTRNPEFQQHCGFPSLWCNCSSG